MSDLKVNVALFTNDRPNAKTQFRGYMKFKANELEKLLNALKEQEENEHGNLELPMVGWLKKTKAGKNWVSAVAEIPLVRKPYSTELTPAVDSLAAAFPGSVVIEDDF
tara:strand:- start:198 stop:521 length:324 start_codon:yes stop_codon:yes gene_type:complete